MSRSRRLFLSVFANEEDLLGAVRAARKKGLRIVDAHTPYAVHGLDRAMGLAPSRLSRVCLLCGAFGALLALSFQFWASAVDWPINVGGRPWNSLPAFVPIIFELMVLFGGLGVVLAFFIVSRLYPGKQGIPPIPDPAGDRFVLILEECDATFDPRSVHRMFQDFNAIHTEERDDQPPERRPFAPALKGLNIALAVTLAVVVILTWTLGGDASRPNREFWPEMVYAVPYDTYAPNSNFPDDKTLQRPEAGTIPQGRLPMQYQATPEDALRAGEELKSAEENLKQLLEMKEIAPEQKQRGAQLFANFCQVCHGPAGKGDGPVTQRGVPPPPSLLAEKALKMKDGQMFHIMTHGQGNMASYASSLSPKERWQVILHIRELQKPALQAAGKRD